MKQLWKSRAGLHVPRFCFRQEYQAFQKQQEKREQFAKFERFLQNAYQTHQQDIEKIDQALRVQQSAIFTSDKPVKAILVAYMQAKKNRTNETLIANTFEQLALTYKSFGGSHNSYWDTNVHELNDNAIFDVLVKDALKHVFDAAQIAQVAWGAAQIGVSDQNFLSTIITRGFQAILNPPKQLVDEPAFQAFLSEFFTFENSSKPSSELLEEFEDLSLLTKQTQEDVFRLVESIDEIRRVYQLLLKAQEKNFLAEEVQLNIEMLEFEEALVELGLLSNEDLNQKPADSLQIALQYISQGEEKLKQFLEAIVKVEFKKSFSQLKFETQKVDYGKLLLGLAEIGNMQLERILNRNYETIVVQFKQCFELVKQEPNLDIAQAYAHIGLYKESKQLLERLKISDQNALQYLSVCLEINHPIAEVAKITRQQDLSLLSNDLLIQLAIANAKYGKLEGTLKQELENRFANVENIYDLDVNSRSRLADLSFFLRNPTLLPVVNGRINSEFYDEIVRLFPGQSQFSEYSNFLEPQLLGKVYLVSSDNCSQSSELSGFMDFRMKNLGCKHITVLQLLHKDRKTFSDTIKRVFDISQEDLIQFNEIKDKLTNLKESLRKSTEVSETLLSQFDIKTIVATQLTYLVEKALSQLNQFYNLKSSNQKAYLQQQLKASLLEIREKARISKISVDFSAILSSIPSKSFKSPKWLSLIPSQALYKTQDSLEGFKASLLDTSFMLSKEYCPYSDLKNTLQLLGFLPIDSVLPNHEKFRKQIVPQHQLSWRQFLDKVTDEVRAEADRLHNFLMKDQFDHRASRGDFFAVNLLNLKQELKEKQPAKITEEVLTLEIWDRLLEEKVANQKSKVSAPIIQRSALELLQYYLNKQKQPLSKSIEFLSKKLSENEALNNMIELRKELLEKLNKDVKEKQIPPQDAQQIYIKVNSILQEKMEDYKAQLQQQHSSLYYTQKNNFIEVVYTEADVQKLQIIDNYDEYLDVDTLLSQGNHLQYLELKRSRAEEKILLYRLLLKLQQGQKLNQNEKLFVEQLDLYQPKVSITQLSIKDLSPRDQEYFSSFLHSNITKFDEFSLSDLIFELSEVFDSQLFRDVLLKKYLQRNGVQYEIRRKNGQLYIHEQEEKIWNQQGRLTPKELKDLKELFAVPQIMTWLREDQRMKELQKVDAALEHLNQRVAPLSRIKSYIEAKTREGRVNVELSENAGEDLEIWTRVFGTDYRTATAKELHTYVEQLVQRTYILKYHQPVIFRRLIKMLLLHPNLSALDKKTFEGFWKELRLSVDFNSKDILDLAEQPKGTQEYLQDVSFPYGEKLWAELSL